LSEHFPTGFLDASQQPADPQQQSHAQRDRYSDGQNHDRDTDYDRHRPKQVADADGTTPESAWKEERPGLIERCREARPRQQWFFEAPGGKHHGLPFVARLPTRS
jgi:hypothetical protein